jgi:hypothetical protein
MSNRRVMPIVLILLIGMVGAEDRVQSELRFAAHTKGEKTRGSGGRRADASPFPRISEARSSEYTHFTCRIKKLAFGRDYCR